MVMKKVVVILVCCVVILFLGEVVIPRIFTQTFEPLDSLPGHTVTIQHWMVEKFARTGELLIASLLILALGAKWLLKKSF